MLHSLGGRGVGSGNGCVPNRGEDARQYTKTRTDRRVELHDVVRAKEDPRVPAGDVNESDGTGDGHESHKSTSISGLEQRLPLIKPLTQRRGTSA